MLKIRLLITYLITILIVLLGYLMYSDPRPITGPVLGSAMAIALPATILLFFLWETEWEFHIGQRVRAAEEDQNEKRKRDRLDAVLRELSTEELSRLRQRLGDGMVDDDHLEELLVGEDGELVRRNSNQHS